MTKSNSSAWYHQPLSAVIIGLAALVAAYGVASLALNSGSLMQYAITIGLITLSLNRLVHVAKKLIGYYAS